MDFKDALLDIKNDMIGKEEVFEAVQRGYTNLNNASEEEIVDYFSSASPEEFQGHVSNVKGILFEQEVQDKFNDNGIESELFEMTNHPGTDIQILSDNEVLQELQLKATDSTSYINETLATSPDIQIVATSEVANKMATEEVINSEISNAALEETVIETLSPIPVSPTGLLVSGALFVLTGGLFA